jgi:hypothetical protein
VNNNNDNRSGFSFRNNNNNNNNNNNRAGFFNPGKLGTKYGISQRMLLVAKPSDEPYQLKWNVDPKYAPDNKIKTIDRIKEENKSIVLMPRSLVKLNSIYIRPQRAEKKLKYSFPRHTTTTKNVSVLPVLVTSSKTRLEKQRKKTKIELPPLPADVEKHLQKQFELLFT